MAKRSFLGVEIGNSRLKLAETKNQRLVRFATEDMPDDIVRQGEIVQWEAMADFLKDSFKKNGFSCKNAAVVVPDSIAYTRRTRMPPMSAAQLERALTALHAAHEGAVTCHVVQMSGIGDEERAALDTGDAQHRAAVLAPWMDMDPQATLGGDRP